MSFNCFLVSALVTGSALATAVQPVTPLCQSFLATIDESNKPDSTPLSAGQRMAQIEEAVFERQRLAMAEMERTLEELRNATNVGDAMIKRFRQMTENARRHFTTPPRSTEGDQIGGPKFRPLPADLRIPRRHARSVLARSRRTNVSYEVLALGLATEDLSEERAGAAGRKIVSQILRAGASVQKGNFKTAIEMLDDPTLFNGTLYHHDGNREDMPVDSVREEHERPLYYLLVRNLRRRPSVSAPGVVIIPRPPRTASSPRDLRWAQRAWLRIAGEELGHVAQILLDRENPDHGRISQMLSPERSITRSLVAMESDRLNQRAVTALGRKLLFGFHNKEADIYAFLIEAFGPEFIPSWVGVDSGYAIRRFIDDELTAQRVPDRAWPTEAELSRFQFH